MAKYEQLTRYLSFFENEEYGKLIVDEDNDGSPEHPRRWPFIDYSPVVNDFRYDLFDFCKKHPEYEHTSYIKTLNNYGINNANEVSQDIIDNLPAKATIALLVAVVRAERICDGAILGNLEDGNIQKWLKRLKNIDDNL